MKINPGFFKFFLSQFLPLGNQTNKGPLLTKHADNPVISPVGENYWESLQTFNPGAVLIDDKVHLIYRAMSDNNTSVMGYATTPNIC